LREKIAHELLPFHPRFGSNKSMSQDERPKPEPEWTGPIWKHPYFLYIWLTLGLFVFLLLMAYLATQEGWIPSR